LKWRKIDFNIYVLRKVTGYADCLLKEARDIQLLLKDVSRDGGFTLSEAW
jgi:hypothetical protein